MGDTSRASQLTNARPTLRLVPPLGEMPGAEPVRVVVVDDHPLLRDAVRMACEEDSRIQVVGEAGNGNAALDACARLQPDVLVLDVGLPGIDGFEVARRLKEQGSAVRILILTGMEDPSAVFESRRIGVDAFVEKQ